jgi:HlyD family secretion protein
MRGWALVGLLTLLGCAGGRDPLADVPSVQVKKQKFTRTVEADGHLRAVKSIPITVPPEVDGPVRLMWLAADGIAVKKGDVVARFDDMELKSQLAQAEDARSMALTKKQKEALLTATTRAQRRRTTEAARRELELSQAYQRRDSEIFSRDQIIESEIDQTLQAAKADHAQKAQGVDGTIAARKLQMLEVETKKAERSIERTRKGLTNLEVRAPADGVLVLKRTWRGEVVREGDTVWRSETIAEVSGVQQLEAEVFVLEVEAAGLAKGKKAQVRLETQPPRNFEAVVSRVETVAKRRQPKSPTQYFGVVLALSKTDPAVMKPGQRVRARLQVDDREALVVPRPALFDRDGKWTVYRREGNGFTPVQVKLGASTAGLVAIESGLKPDDVIALREPGRSPDETLAAPATRGAAARR